MNAAESKAIPIPIWLLAVGAFLIPLLGGSLYVEATTLGPGIGALLQSVFHGADTPQAQYLLISLPFAAALCWPLLGARLLAVPSSRLVAMLIVFFGLLAFSVFASPVKFITLQSLTNWAAYGLGFFAVSATVGRVRGPTVVIAALVAGCAVLSLGGVLEWGATKATDPTWRIFAGWNNPNALADMLVIGFVLSLALACVTEGLPGLLATVAIPLIGLALFLTQSRGGLLAAFVGLVVFLPSAWKARKEEGAAGSSLPRLGLGLGLAAALTGLAVLSTRSAAGSAGSRLIGNAATAQSNGFRKLLWESCLQLMRGNPMGYGLNSFSVVSTRPGLTTQTILAHSTMLQLGVEASVIAPLVFLGAIGLWFWKGLRAPRQEAATRLLAAGVRAAILAALVDGVFESNLFFFGTGLAFFVLLGLGLQLSADSVTPEVAPASLRFTSLGAVCVLLISSGYFATVEVMKARARYDREVEPSAFAESAGSLKSIAPGDAEAYFLASLAERSPEADLRTSLELGPTSKTARALARAQATLGKPELAAQTLRKALDTDPNNLLVLQLLLDTEIQLKDTGSATEVARRMVEVEKKPYFEVRSIPELVPLQTVAAHLYLADQAPPTSAEAAAQLEGALALYVRYADTTVGNMIDGIKKSGPEYRLADESPEAAHGKLEEAHALAARLSAIYGALGRPADVARVDAAGASLLDAEGRLADALSPSK
jgi:tetratricopeptide (TPR) repeat protein